jgi:hypothetical protein
MAKWIFEDELPCDITTRLFDLSKVIDGVRMYPCCGACGDLLKHDDDGPRLCRRAMKDLVVSGSPNGAIREQAIEAAISIIQRAPETCLTKGYIGVKNYAAFGDQREDHDYGMGPRHGYIVFSIMRTTRTNPAPLGDDHVYLLECVRDFGTFEDTRVDVRSHQSRYHRNLCDAIKLADEHAELSQFYRESIERIAAEMQLSAASSWENHHANRN